MRQILSIDRADLFDMRKKDSYSNQDNLGRFCLKIAVSL